MSQDLYAQENYKKAIRDRLKDQQKTNPSLTLKKIADIIPVQYTYLSKVLNHDEFHLNEDHLYIICKTLKWDIEETEFVLALRAWTTAQDADRKKYLFKKVESLRRQKKLAVEQRDLEGAKLSNELNYLMNPLCIILHVALSSEAIRKNPLQLCQRMGLTQKQLKENLKILAMNDMIVFGEDHLDIKEVKQRHFHLGRNHPLMRLHQNQLKTHMVNRLNMVEEEEKQTMMVTFTSNPAVFEEIKEEFNAFLKKAQTLSQKSQKPKDHQEVYHLSFDFFKYL